MKPWGYGEGYQHAQQFEDAMECLLPSPTCWRSSKMLRLPRRFDRVFRK